MKIEDFAKLADEVAGPAVNPYAALKWRAALIEISNLDGTNPYEAIAIARRALRESP